MMTATGALAFNGLHEIYNFFRVDFFCIDDFASIFSKMMLK